MPAKFFLQKTVRSSMARRAIGLSLVLVSSLTVVACGGGSSDKNPTIEKPAPHVTWLREKSIALSTIDPKAPNTELAVLGEKIGNASIIGLGEATHGSSDFQKMNHRIFRYLVEHKGVTAFGLETQMGATRALDRYVFSGEGDPKTALKEQGFGMYVTQEMLDLVLWMRSYNADPSHTQKLHIFGFDMQYVAAEIDVLESYILSVDAAAAPTFTTWYAGFKPYSRSMKVAGAYYYEKPLSFRTQISEDISKAYQWLVDHRIAYTASKGEVAYTWAVQMAKNVVENQKLYAFNPTVEADDLRAQTHRDTHMANNVEWYQKLLGSGSKLAIYVHNGHVNKATYDPRVETMGNILSSRRKLDYFSLGYVFYAGGLNARDSKTGEYKAHMVPPASADSYAEAFALAGLTMSFLDLRNLSTTEPGALWIKTSRPLREPGGVWDTTPGYALEIANLPNRFDAMIFIKNISAAKQIY